MKKFKEFINENIINTNYENISKGSYDIYFNGDVVGNFSISMVGNVEVDPLKSFNIDERPVYTNSIFFNGGFIINYDKHKQGIGKKTIENIFNDNKTIDNIFLYAIDWQGAVGFWLKIGGNVVYEKEGLFYIQLKRSNII